MPPSDVGFSAHRPRTEVSTLDEWTRHQDISDRLFNPGMTTIPGLLADAEMSIPRPPPGPSLPSRSVLSPVTPSVPSSHSGASGKPRLRQSNRSGSSNFALSINEALLSVDSSSLLSWTTSSTAPTMSELDHTDLAPIQGVFQLIPNGDTIEPTSIPPPTFSCRFWFLDCSYASPNELEWKEHNLSHFRGHVPPQSNTCPLCDMTFNIPDPTVSWAASMSHVAQHLKDGETMTTTRPEFALFRHLWAKRIICDADYQELLGQCNLRHGTRPYVVLERRDRRERRGYSTPQPRM